MKYLFILSFLLFALPASAIINQDKDFQIWIHSPWRYDINRCSRLYFDVEGRWGNESRDLYLAYGQVRYGLDVAEWLELAPGYRQLYFLQLSDRSWQTIYFPFADAVLKWDWQEWKIENRNRVEYLIFEFRDNIRSYRNRLQLTPPWRLGRYGLIPTVSNEVFFREGFGYAQNRFITQITFPFSPHVQWKVYYLLRHMKRLDKQWIHHNVLGLRFYFAF